MTAALFAREMTRLCVAFGRHADEMLFAIYADALQDFTDANMIQATNRALQLADGFPPITVLRSLGFGGARHGRPTPGVVSTQERLALTAPEPDPTPASSAQRAKLRQVIADLAARFAGPAPVNTAPYVPSLKTPEQVQARKAELLRQAQQVATSISGRDGA